MKPKITKIQLLEILNLLTGLKDFENKGLGKILNLLTLYNFTFPDSIFVKYEKDFMQNGTRTYDFNIAEIKKDGTVSFIDEVFQNPYQRYSFLSECKVFDINDESTFDKID